MDFNLVPSLDLIFLLLMTGAAGGFLSGLLGVGGGVIFVPALFFVFERAGLAPDHLMHLALGTSLACALVSVSVSARVHAQNGTVEAALVRRYAPFVAGGVLLGGLFAGAAHGAALVRLFALLLLALAAHTALWRDDAAKSAQKKPSIALSRAFFTFTGFVSAVGGVAGAALTVPFLSHSGVPFKSSIGTAAALGVVATVIGATSYALAGFIGHAPLPALTLGYIHLGALFAVAPVAVVFAPLGVAASRRLPVRVLKMIFAGLLILLAFKMLWGAHGG